MFTASADCCYLSGIRASLFCLDTRSPRHSCPPCPSQRQTCLQSPWHNLPKAQGRGENKVQTEKLILLMHQVHLVYSMYDVVFCVKWKCAYWECRQKTKTPTDADYLRDVKVLNKNSSPNWNRLPDPKNKKINWSHGVCTKHHVR